MNIFLRGGGFSNKGAEAMLLTAQREIAKRIPDANFYIHVPLRQVERAFTYGFTPLLNPGSRIRKGGRLLWACAGKKCVRRAALINFFSAQEIHSFESIDCVLDISGFNYSDEWGIHLANRGLAWADYCHSQGKDHICLPQTWGPFNNRRLAAAVQRLCEYSTIIYTRDSTSHRYIERLLNGRNGKAYESSDIAFLFDAEGPEAGRSILESTGFETGSRPLIGLTPNLRVYERFSGVGIANTYVKLMLSIIEYCIVHLEAAVVLLPHEIALGLTPRKDDRFISGLIKAAVTHNQACFCVSQDLQAATLKSVVGHLDFLIGSRYHSLVFASALGVPSLALGWNHKYAELMDSVGLGKYIVDYKNFERAAVFDILNEAWCNREQMSRILNDRLPQIKQDARSVFDHVAQVLTGSVVEVGSATDGGSSTTGGQAQCQPLKALLH